MMSSPPESMRTIACRVNGAEVQVELPARSPDGSPRSGWTLLEMLRDKLGLVSPKDGCQPQAQCGCCTVLVDGKPTLSCATRAEKAEGGPLAVPSLSVTIYRIEK